MDPSSIDRSAIDQPPSVVQPVIHYSPLIDESMGLPEFNPTWCSPAINFDMSTPWLMFERFVFRRDEDDGSFPDAKAAPIRAKSVTSLGQPFTVALSSAKPPAVSRLYLQWPGGKGSGTELLTTDLGFLLLRLTSVVELSAGETDKDPYKQDYFICKTIPVPPYMSLKRLPECTIPIVFTAGDRKITTDRRFHADAVGLCHLNDKFVVVQLAKFFVQAEDQMGVELCVLCSHKSNWYIKDGSNAIAEAKWEVVELPIRHLKEEFNDISCWSVDSAITYGSTIIWVDYHQGGMLCFTPRIGEFVEYYRLPIDNRPRDSLPSRYNLEKYRRLCVTQVNYPNSQDVLHLKFVDVVREDGTYFGPISPGSSFTVTYHTFTPAEDQKWRKDVVLPSRKIQYLNSRNPFMPSDAVTTFPVLSMDNPNLVYFLVSEKRDMIDKLSVVAIDIFKENMVSVDQYIQGDEDLNGEYADMVRHRSRLPRSFLPSQFLAHI